MKIKVSMRKIQEYSKEGYKIFRAGYCRLQYILDDSHFQFYNSGVYGWNCDIFVDYTNKVIVTTGYRGMIGNLIPNEIINSYSAQGQKIRRNMSCGDQQELLNENENRFILELTKL